MTVARTNAMGSIPAWATTFLIGLLCWLLNHYATNIERIQEQHNTRISNLELWRAKAEK